MPYANPHNCAASGCKNAVLGKKRHCPEHTKAKNQQDYLLYRKDSPHQKVYKTKAWANTRRYQLAMHPFCVECLKLGIENAKDIEIDHVIPLKRYEGDPLDPSNLQSLCISHHGVKTRAGD